MSRLITIVALAVACASLLLAVFPRARGSDSRTTAAPGDPSGSLTAQFGQIQKNQEALLASNRELHLKVAQLERASGAATIAPAELARLRLRVDELEVKNAELAQTTSEIDKYGIVAGLEKELLNAYSTVLDTNQPLGARIKQAGILKRNGHFDEQAVKAVADLYRQTDDLKEKGTVLIALKGSVTPDLRDQILVDLNREFQEGNHSGWFRYFAVEALEPMLPDPTVQEWLNHLAQNDPDPKIAARAGKPLGTEASPSATK